MKWLLSSMAIAFAVQAAAAAPQDPVKEPEKKLTSYSFVIPGFG